MSENQATSPAVWLARQVPTLLVLAALIGLYHWGSLNDWKLPFLATPEEEEKKKEGDGPSGFPGRIKLDDDDSADAAGIETAPVKRRAVTDHVEAPAVLAWDQTKLARLAPRAAGTVFRVQCKLGQRVNKDDALLYVVAPEVGKLKADFLSAAIGHDVKRRTLDRLEKAGTTIPERQLLDAQHAVRETRVALINAQQALANLGLVLTLEEAAKLSDDALARRLRRLGLPEGKEELPASLLPVRAPFAGVVVRLDAVVGEMAETSKPVVAVADPTRVWCLLDVRQEDAGWIQKGQAVTFTSRAASPADGEITWVSPEADPKTRTVKARAELSNSGALRPGVFGTAVVQLRKREALLVPARAVQFTGGGHVVFLRRSKQEFEPRLVLPGRHFGEEVELLGPMPLLPASLVGMPGWPALGAAPLGLGLEPLREGEAVVTVGSHALLSEMFKSQLEGGD
jgi:cobalt-zinc-cadmium efflux system membrane fusion protein